MKTKQPMLLRRNVLVVAVGSALATLAVPPAAADPLLTIKLFRDSEVLFRDADMSRWADNYIELGLGYNSEDSLRFGQFSGLTDAGVFAIGGFNWLSRDKTDDAQYWRVFGANLGLESRKLHAEGGAQGRWSINFSLDQLNKSQTDTARFLHGGLGTSSLTTPVPAAAATTATAANFPDASFSKFDIQHGRDIYRLGLAGLLGKEWDFRVNYREDQRDGNRLTGIVYSSGGVASILPYAIDDKTQQIEAALSYTTKETQLQFAYHYSKFSNNLSAFNVQSPFAGVSRENRLSLAPDNDYHQLVVNGAHSFSKVTRLSANLSYGVARQNETFLPYSANGAGATAALPRGSLDGKVVNTLLDVALTTKPVDKMNLKLAYQYRESDNKTPISQFTYVGRDGAGALPTIGAVPNGTNGSNAIRSNAPINTREDKVVLEGDYEIAEKTVLRAGLEHSTKDYTRTDRAETETNRFSIELRRPVSAEFLGSVGYTYTQRRGSTYDKNTFFNNTYTDTAWQQNIVGGSLTNHPSMRSMLYNDYDEHRVRGFGNWTVNETVSMQGGIDHNENRAKDRGCNSISDADVVTALAGQAAVPVTLPDTCLGRKVSETTSANLDLQWQPEENLTTFAFYNFGETRMKQAGRTWRTDLANTVANGSTTNEALTAADMARDWSGDSRYRDQAIGIGLKWQPEERWDLGGTYVFNHGIGKHKVSQSAAPITGTANSAGNAGNAAGLVTSTPLPDTWSKLHSLQFFAKWDYSKQLSWRFNYLYENLRSYDWAVSDLGTTVPGVTQVIYTGQQAPRYNNHVVGVSAVIKNW